MKQFFIVLLLSFFLYSSLNAIQNNSILENELPATSSSLSKEEKLLYLNITTTVGMLSYGAVQWGYDIINVTPHGQSEGWFAKDTKHGGMDKFAHAYVGYFSSHMFSYAYENWGYTHDKAALYGAYSSFLFTTIMEVGDSFSDFGLSYEDMVANTVGAVYGYYSYKYEQISDVIDYRVDYEINELTYKDDFALDYEHMKYLLAIKGSGFNNRYIKYLEVYLGYYITGYKTKPYDKQRHGFVGFGVNLSEVFNTKIFNYYQVPNIYLSNDFD